MNGESCFAVTVLAVTLFFACVLTIVAAVTPEWVNYDNSSEHLRYGLLETCVETTYDLVCSPINFALWSSSYSLDYASLQGRYYTSFALLVLASALYFIAFFVGPVSWICKRRYFRTTLVLTSAALVAHAVGMVIYLQTVDYWMYGGVSFCVYREQILGLSSDNCVESYGYSFAFALSAGLVAVIACITTGTMVCTVNRAIGSLPMAELYPVIPSSADGVQTAVVRPDLPPLEIREPAPQSSAARRSLSSPQPRHEQGPPMADDWVFVPSIKLYWSPSAALYLDPGTKHLYDPKTEKWYDPEEEEWYE